jgi:hypothetical protein
VSIIASHRDFKRFLLLPFFLLLFVNCEEGNKNNATYFGGQIINPKSNKIYLYKGEKLLDSALLDAKHKFLIKIDTLLLGLYIFKHYDEIQYIYLEPKDSLLMRLNTWAFDESLVFSGRGAERNNLLINLFLENEKEDKSFFDFYALNDSLFELKIDSVLQRKKLLYNQFKEEVPETSPLFDKLVNAAIYFPLYRKKEAYPYRYKKTLKTADYPHLSPTFYKFRKDININDKELINFYPYQDYVKTYLYHLAFEKQILNDDNGSIDVNFMKEALENLEIDDVKNNFLHQGMWFALLDENISKEEKAKAQRLFFDHCSDEKSVADIANLIKAAERSPKGEKLPDITVFDYDGNPQQLNDIIQQKNVVIYTWPTNLRQIENMAKRVNYLEKKYTNYLFIGINSKNAEYQWKKHIQLKKLNPKHQYRTTDIDWLDVSFARAILINKKGVVQNNMTHLLNRHFEKQLKRLKN